LIDQWLTFQASGQGPYYGQAAWFQLRHPEKIPSAIERYQKETIRIISVLDGVLAKQKYLVGNKLTVADLCFYSWNYGIFNAPHILKDSPSEAELQKYKNFLRWNEEVEQFESVKKAYAIREALPES